MSRATPAKEAGKKAAPKDPRAHWFLLVLCAIGIVAALTMDGFAHGTLGESPHQKDGAGRLAPQQVLDSNPIITTDGTQPRSIGLPPKTIALTFDDGPDPTWTPKILDVLHRHGAHGTFFAVGARIAQNPGIIRRMIREGNEVGSHTYTHIDMGAAPAWRNKSELELTQRALAGAAGVRTHLLRPPYSSEPEAVTALDWRAYQAAGREGYVLVLTDRDTEDWSRPGVDKIVASALAGRPGVGAVIMLHDAGGDRSQTVAALDQIVPRLQSQGYRLTTVSEALRMPPAYERANGSQRALGGALGFAQRYSSWFTGALTAFFALTAILTVLRLTMLLVMAWVHARRRRRRPPLEYGADPPAVSVIVPAYNEEASIAATIRSLTETDHPGPLEVIVIDDGSGDRTSEIAESCGLPNVRVIRQPNGGKPTALNTGIAYAKHDLLVMVDGDTIFQRDTIPQLIRPFTDPEVGAVSGNAKVANRRGLLGGWQHVEYVVGFNLDRRLYDLMGVMPTIPGAIGAYRREALAGVGGISTDTLAEDTDLSMAICRAGWRITYEEKALAWTEAPESLRQLWRQRYRWCYGTLQAMWKHKRSVIERGRSGRFGRWCLLYLALFQVVLPLFAPAVDVFLPYGLLVLDPATVAVSWVAFLGVQMLASAYALRLDGERLRPLWTMPLQQIVYRQLMYLVVVQSVVAAVLGSRLRWHTILRTGTFFTPERLPAEDLGALPVAGPPAELTGRSNGLALIGQALDSAAQGLPELVVIEGPAGIGKSALIDRAASIAAERGFTVAVARCAPPTRDLAYGTVRLLFTDALDRATGIAPSEDAELAERVLTDRLRGDHSERESAALQKAARFGLHRLTADLAAAAPLLLIVDDLHWADEASLRWLPYLIRRWAGMRVLLVATVDTREPVADRQTLDDLLGGALRMALTPLSGQDTGQILSERFGTAPDETFVNVCRETTGGNPFLLEELAATLQARGLPPAADTTKRLGEFGPAAVVQIILDRLQQAGPASAAFASTMAVLGGPADLAVAGEIAGLRITEAAEARELLLRYRILREDDRGLSFHHDSVRSAAAANLTSGERSALHARAAHVLRTRRAAAEEIATHIIGGDLLDEPWARDVLREAARVARQRGAPSAVTTYLAHAARSAPPDEQVELLTELGAAQAVLAPGTAEETLRTALSQAEEPGARIRIAAELARLALARHGSDAAVRILGAELTDVPDPADWEPMLRLLGLAVHEDALGGTGRQWLDRFRDEAGQDWRVAAVGAMAAVDSGEPAEAWTLPATVPDDHADQVFLWGVLPALLKLDRSPLLRAYAREALGLALRRGWLEYAAEGHLVLGLDSYEDGRLAEAEGDLTASYAMWQAIDAPQERGVGMIVAVLVEQGRLDEAEEILVRCGHRDTSTDRLRPFPYLLYARGTWKAARGDDHWAVLDFRASGAAYEGQGQLGPLVPWRERAALSLRILGRATEARELAVAAVRSARRASGDGFRDDAVATALATAGTVVPEDEGLALLDEAITLFRFRRLELARALIARARLRHEAGLDSGAADDLRRAHELAAECGARPLAGVVLTG